MRAWFIIHAYYMCFLNNTNIAGRLEGNRGIESIRKLTEVGILILQYLIILDHVTLHTGNGLIVPACPSTCGTDNSFDSCFSPS
jgi:hypothetical protein